MRVLSMPLFLGKPQANITQSASSHVTPTAIGMRHNDTFAKVRFGAEPDGWAQRDEASSDFLKTHDLQLGRAVYQDLNTGKLHCADSRGEHLGVVTVASWAGRGKNKKPKSYENVETKAVYES